MFSNEEGLEFDGSNSDAFENMENEHGINRYVRATLTAMRMSVKQGNMMPS
jgi:hypothetical protein